MLIQSLEEEELRRYAENTKELYPLVRLAIKEIAGCEHRVSVCSRCLVSWTEIVDEAAELYNEEVSRTYFDHYTRTIVAVDWANDYYQRLMSGEKDLYDTDA